MHGTSVQPWNIIDVYIVTCRTRIPPVLLILSNISRIKFLFLLTPPKTLSVMPFLILSPSRTPTFSATPRQHSTCPSRNRYPSRSSCAFSSSCGTHPRLTSEGARLSTSHCTSEGAGTIATCCFSEGACLFTTTCGTSEGATIFHQHHTTSFPQIPATSFTRTNVF